MSSAAHTTNSLTVICAAHIVLQKLWKKVAEQVQHIVEDVDVPFAICRLREGSQHLHHKTHNSPRLVSMSNIKDEGGRYTD